MAPVAYGIRSDLPVLFRNIMLDDRENRGGVKTLFMRDTLGNVIETRNMDTGAQTSSTTYWPYGEVRTQDGTNPSPFGFCGEWGYYTHAGQPTYVRARYYRPNLGRWQTVDPPGPFNQNMSSRNRPAPLFRALRSISYPLNRILATLVLCPRL